MIVIFEKMAVFIIFLAAGYIFARTKLVSPEFNKGLSKLMMNFFLVGMILSSVVNKDIEMSGMEIIESIGIWFLLLVITLTVAWVTPKLLRIKTGDIGMYRLMVGFMNNGFVGVPLVGAIYGSGMLFFASLSNISFNILLYTVGIVFLQSGQEGAKIELKRIINAPIIATLLAIVIFATRIHIPAFIDETLDYLATATVPVSMLCVGLSLGSVPLKEAFNKPRLYLLNVVRLIVCPLLVWLIMRGIISDPVKLSSVVIMAGTPMAVICTILGIEYGRDGIESSEGILLSTVLSMVTIPVIVTVLGL